MDQRPAGRWRTVSLRAARLGALLLVPYCLVVLVLMFFEESLIFHPDRYPVGDWQPEGLAFQDVWFESADGEKLHGWYVPCDEPRAVVLFSHGNAGNLSHRADRLRLFHDLRIAAMIYDYRGYGRSSGKPNEKGVLLDARAARAKLASLATISEAQVVLMGRSLGAAVAVDLAASDGARGLILESAFSSLPDVAEFHYSWIPVRRVMRSSLDSWTKIEHYHGPLLQSHGTADTVVPFHFGRRLFEAANEPKQFIEIAGADHNDPNPPEYYRRVVEFLDSLPGP